MHSKMYSFNTLVSLRAPDFLPLEQEQREQQEKRD